MRAELLPVFASGGRPWLLRPGCLPALRLPVPAAMDPAEVVEARLRRGRLRATIVHSTSWRWAAGELLVTYLAVLREPPRAPGLVAEPVRRCDLARGAAGHAPGDVQVPQVIEHGLRHLAWLDRDDAAVAAALSGEWRTILREYRPEPFGLRLPRAET